MSMKTITDAAASAAFSEVGRSPWEVLSVEGGRHVKMWTRGVPVDEQA